MAFEAYLTQDATKPKKGRRITYTVSLALHGAAIVFFAVYSFWHVEELSPPSVTVTFLSAAPPPPPPPPPPKKKSSSKTKTTKTEIKRPTQLTQPTDKKPEPKEEPEEEEDGQEDGEEGGEEGGVAGGVKGGVVGGTVGGVIGGTGEPAQNVSPNVAAGQLAIDPNVAPYKLELPGALNRPGYTNFAMVKVCVEGNGSVKSANLVKRADPLIDDQITQKIRIWKYKPYQINGRTVPFCYMLRYQIRAEI